MLKKIESKKAPTAIGPYSQAIIAPSGLPLLFVSGMLPLDPETGALVQGDIRILTKRVLDNIEAVLKQAGSDFQHVVRCDVFLKDLQRDFAGMNEEYSKYFTSNTPPARQTIEVSQLPKGAIVEISCIAVIP